MAQHTAVEILVENLKMIIPINQWNDILIQDAINQAKQMDKKQKIEFAKHCLDKAYDLDIRTAFLNLEQYYNKTYGKE